MIVSACTAARATSKCAPCAESPVGPMLVVHLIYDCRDAMGANMVNTACEALAPLVEEITGGRVNLRILSNLADRRLARARCVVPARELATGDIPRRAGGAAHRRGLRAGRGRSLPRGDAQQGHHERRGCRGPGHRQRLARDRGRRARLRRPRRPRTARCRPGPTSPATRQPAQDPRWSAAWSCRWRSASSAAPRGCTRWRSFALQIMGVGDRARAGRDHRRGRAWPRTWRPSARWRPRASSGATWRCTRGRSPSPPARGATRWTAVGAVLVAERQIRADRAQECSPGCGRTEP